MAGLNQNPSALDTSYQWLRHVIVEPITFAKENVVVDVQSAKLPAGALVVGGGAFITTAFNDSGTDTLDVGFRDGTTTDDPNGLGTIIDITSAGFKPLDELAATTNIPQGKDCILTWQYNGENNDATAGAGFLIVEYVLPVS